MNRLKNPINALSFLKLAYRSPRVPSPYEQLSRGSLWTWFMPKEKLRDNYLHATRNIRKKLNLQRGFEFLTNLNNN